jgi:hypothetical protein
MGDSMTLWSLLQAMLAMLTSEDRIIAVGTADDFNRSRFLARKFISAVYGSAWVEGGRSPAKENGSGGAWNLCAREGIKLAGYLGLSFLYDPEIKSRSVMGDEHRSHLRVVQ